VLYHLEIVGEIVVCKARTQLTLAAARAIVCTVLMRFHLAQQGYRICRAIRSGSVCLARGARA